MVDWYAGHLVVGEYVRRQTVPQWLPAMGRAVAEALGVAVENLHLKARRVGKQDGERYRRMDYTDRKIMVTERDLTFLVNPYDYVDTGLFSDHRNTRQMVREMAAGKDFLNLYCYTAAFTCYAAKGGARTSVSVDRSDTAIKWARENLAINGISREAHALVQAPTLDFLKKILRARKTFDLAVVDPPSFSTTQSRNDDFDIVRDHPDLLHAVIEVMRPGATIFFSTNHQSFEPQMTELEAAGIEEITDATIPEDYVRHRTPIHRCWRISV